MLKNKVAVITGGSRGIGKAIVLDFAKNGADVAVLCSKDIEKANEVCLTAMECGVRAKAFVCDVSDFDTSKSVCQEIVDYFGKVDILVNNAGITKDTLLLRMSETDFSDVLDVNLKGAFNFTKHLSRYIMKSASGRIINISSVSGLVGNAGQINYSASKSGLIGFTKSVAKEFSSKNVTCNAIAPGFIDTDMTSALSEKAEDYIKTAIPLKRMGNPDEVANLATFLASELSSYITGEVVKIDGGMCM